MIKQMSTEVILPESVETVGMARPKMLKANSVAGTGLSLSANKKTSTSAF